MKSIKKLVDIVEKLRAPDGCPWDRKQTHRSLIPYLIEEAHEVIDEIEQDELGDELKEELGDLLLQVVLHAQIATEEKRFSFDDVVNGIAEKLIRRHPHVFDPEWKEVAENELRQQWEQIKSEENKGKKKKKASIFDGIPKSAPALNSASRIGEKASNLGFDWENHEGALEKIEEELQEVRVAIHENQKEDVKEEIGDLLFAITNLARHFEIDPESALKATNEKFKYRFKFVEHAIRSAEKEGKKLSLKEMDKHWDQAKNKNYEKSPRSLFSKSKTR
ncbi:MAG: tetrapyrrole methylase family protein/MazG family protein [bacterium]|jgi:tetrapyrrole methylase family protein/MazG family protein